MSDIVWEHLHLPNIPLLKCTLSDKYVQYLWQCIEDAMGNPIDAKSHLAGNISSSIYLEDKDDYFFNNVLKETAEQYVNTFPTNCSKNPFGDKRVTNLVLKSLWVNFSKKHEFNPIHNHNGVLSFVLWVKVPTDWQSQHELKISHDTNLACASNFQFFYNDIFGETRGIIVEMDPMMEGCMLLFPSLLQHQVYPFYENDGYRISVSGNLCFDIKQLKDML